MAILWKIFGESYRERFSRMLNYYLLASVGAFRARYIQLWQIVFSNTDDAFVDYQSTR